MPPLAGNLVGHYQILCQVGAGGMGTVFKAFDTTLQRTVALKFLTPNPTNVIDRDALLREARAASTLDHKNIATVHAIEETDDGHLFLVMAYYDPPKGTFGPGIFSPPCLANDRASVPSIRSRRYCSANR